MTQTPPIDTPLDARSVGDRASNYERFLYYLSFVLLYALLGFISSMIMMGYEDRTGGTLGAIGEKYTLEKFGYATFYILQFPLGLIFGFLTDNYHNGLFAFLMNPLLIAFTLEKFLIKGNKTKVKKASLLNLFALTALALTIVMYIWTE